MKAPKYVKMGNSFLRLRGDMYWVDDESIRLLVNNVYLLIRK